MPLLTLLTPPCFAPRSAYELARIERIKRNNAYLQSIGLASGLVPKSSSSNSNSQKKKRKPTTKPANLAPTVPTRGSSRIRGVKAPNYNQEAVMTSSSSGSAYADPMDYEEPDEVRAKERRDYIYT